jgi:hypothetical protein
MEMAHIKLEAVLDIQQVEHHKCATAALAEQAQVQAAIARRGRSETRATELILS